MNDKRRTILLLILASAIVASCHNEPAFLNKSMYPDKVEMGVYRLEIDVNLSGYDLENKRLFITSSNVNFDNERIRVYLQPKVKTSKFDTIETQTTDVIVKLVEYHGLHETPNSDKYHKFMGKLLKVVQRR